MVLHKEISFDLLVEGKTIAVVGNSTSLFEQSFGAEIDSHDIVIRFNKPANFYCDFDVSNTHGNKTNVWAFWSIGGFIKRTLSQMKDTKLEKQFYENDSMYKIQAAGNGHEKKLISCCDFTFDPSKLQRLNKKLIASSVYQHIDERRYQSFLVRNTSKVPKSLTPSAGIVILEWLTLCKPISVNVYGMDFKRTATFSEPENFEKDMKGRVDIRCAHNFALEEVYVKKYIFTRENYILKD
jgi:hypothetical protein